MADWLPKNDSSLATLCERWLEVLQEIDNIEKYHFDQKDCDAIIPKIKAFTAAYEKYKENDSTANRVLKSEAKKEAMELMRAFAKSSIRFNSRMDGAQKEAMGIAAADTVYSSHARPTSQPHTVIELTGNHFEHCVKAFRHEGRKGTKPADAYGVRFAWQVGGEKPAAGDALPKTRFSRKAVQVITFSEAEAGKIVWYATCYENAKGEAGPWSPLVDMHVW